MPRVHYRNEIARSGVDARAVRAAAQTLLRTLGEDDASLSLTLVGDETMRRLNKAHRGKDRPTDVLSFELHDPIERLLGDVVISIDTARRQAAEYGAPLQREIERLLIHGILHVMGHDHHRKAERARMEREERRLARAIGMPWPYGRAPR